MDPQIKMESSARIRSRMKFSSAGLLAAGSAMGTSSLGPRTQSTLIAHNGLFGDFSDGKRIAQLQTLNTAEHGGTGMGCWMIFGSHTVYLIVARDQLGLRLIEALHSRGSNLITRTRTRRDHNLRTSSTFLSNAHISYMKASSTSCSGMSRLRSKCSLRRVSSPWPIYPDQN